VLAQRVLCFVQTKESELHPLGSSYSLSKIYGEPMTLASNDNLLTQEEFMQAISDRLQEEPDLQIVNSTEQNIEVRIRGVRIDVPVETYFQAYLKDPDAIDNVLDKVVDDAYALVPDRSPASYEELKDRIFPMLKPIKILADIRERNLPMLAYQLLLNDLIVTYVIREPKSVVYINEKHLELWEVNEYTLHSQALENLRRLTNSTGKYKTVGTGAQRLFVWETQDGYDATRLLLTDVLVAWQQQLPGRIVIGVPNRDFLIAFSDSDRNVLEGVARQIQVDAHQQEHGLTDRLFTIRNATLREYEWD
jgi:Uncharacterized protein conserved in bacteria